MTHFSFLSTYPPTRCGLATFTDALSSALIRPGETRGSVVRVLDELELRAPDLPNRRAGVVAHLIANDKLSLANSVRVMDASDVAIVQHEYGIYGGQDGDDVIEVLRRLRTPSVVVLHTVLASPTRHQREVLEEVCELAGAVIVMTDHACETLKANYDVDLSKVHMVPHGAPNWPVNSPHKVGTTSRILTWGLISPGKGIEWALRAVAELKAEGLDVEYVVAGQTHPKVLARDGEAYREMLVRLADDLGISASVTFDSEYRDVAELGQLVSSADVVLLPYDSKDQATSGVLAEAVAAGIPVVATGFPHAHELLDGGAGLIALHQDPQSMAASVRTILTARDVADRMHDLALKNTTGTSWAAVAARYRDIAASLAVRAA